VAVFMESGNFAVVDSGSVVTSGIAIPAILDTEFATRPYTGQPRLLIGRESQSSAEMDSWDAEVAFARQATWTLACQGATVSVWGVLQW
jgi:hypothetical protein